MANAQIVFCLQEGASLQSRAEELPVSGLLQTAVFGVIYANTFLNLLLRFINDIRLTEPFDLPVEIKACYPGLTQLFTSLRLRADKCFCGLKSKVPGLPTVIYRSFLFFSYT